jgi:DNA repair protein RecN (Recombination protein N)
MLQFLRIENLALLEAVELEFPAGYTVVTGETGAGKSVLLGALSLLSGARGDKSLIRQGAQQCVVEAVLETAGSPRLAPLLERLGLPACEEGQLVLRRQLARAGGSRIMVNGGVATLGQLRELGGEWIDFHGPGEPQKLFHESEQLALLDLYAGLKEPLAEYRAGYREWRTELEGIERLRAETRLTPEEAAFLRSQVEEIDALKPGEEAIAQLEQDFRRLSGAQELKELCAQLDEKFLGAKGICARLQSALPSARKLAELDPSATGLADRVESLVIEAGDLAGEWRALAGDSDFNPVQARQIEQRMESWMSLRRRYGGSVAAVLARREAMAERLAVQGDLEGTIARRESAAEKARAGLAKQAAELRSSRLKAANKLAREAETLLRELGFKRPKLEIGIAARRELGPAGDCDCSMAFSPNPGTGALPLNKIASSGEMARVMLALKSVLAAVDATPVLVFDEVDSNIGGEVATAVARQLERLGRDHQVFCVTHLPQVAGVAKNHYVVDKEQSDSSTAVRIARIDADRDARLDELARMLGDRASGSALRHAAELLETAPAPAQSAR